ncbi:tRNA-dependent cyclodipeptide synthase (plasmid) [Legionella lytica]|uniref:Cyclodipeptide synthase n=1 Tax=Legionella lytica TaxID=96232 RepID=A0ABY4YCR3_9GAMM|nr:tRNA-dependent cyclodipeptide synthase [Legionella lytica]USQ15401.1 tRNA-dependent cyclodipeptide synthase [Legionella lytica]
MEYRTVRMNTQPVSEASNQLYSQKEHALLGISPFNSYFSEEAIGLWIEWAKATFSSFHIFIPDTLPVYTFLALGYDEARARQKTKRQAAYLKNKVARALAHHHISGADAAQIIIDMSVLEKNPRYLELKEHCYTLYHTHSAFRDECDQCTGWVLNGQSIKDLHQANENIAVHYILDEMPLFMDTPSILGVNSSLFTYHQTPEFINYLYTDSMGSELIASNQGFIELSVHKQNARTEGVLFNDEFK